MSDPLSSPPAPPVSRWERVSRLWLGDRVLAIALGLLVVYYVIQPGIFEGKHSGDGLHAFNYLKAIFYHQTLDMQDVLPEYKKYIGVNPVTHHMPNRNPIGTVPFWTPFYLLACVVAGVVRLISGIELRGNSPLHAWFCGVGTLAVVLWGMRQLFVLLLRRYGRLAAQLGAIAAVWATAIAWYTVSQPLYQHGVVFGMAAAFTEYWERTLDDPAPKRMALLGVWGGYLAAIRGQEILFLLLPASDIVRGLLVSDQRVAWLRAGVVAVVSSFVGVLPQLLVWYFYFGFNKPHLEPLRPYEPFFLSALFSTRAGLFPWTPIVYASAVGVIAWGLRATERRFVLPLVAAFLLNVYLVACGWLVHGAYGYGARRLSDGAILFAVGVALCARSSEASTRRWTRGLLLAFVAFCCFYNVLAMELQRQRRTGSSGARTRHIADYGREAAGGKDWGAALGAPFGWLGHPFTQPASTVFALWHRVRPSMFDIVVGQPYLERDGAWLGLLDQTKTLLLDREHEGFVASGLQLAPAANKQPALVDGRVRLLLSFFAREKIGVKIVGDIREGATTLLWNGSEIPVVRMPDGLRAEVPALVAHAGTNSITLEVPIGSRLTKLEFDSYSVPTR